MWFDPASPGGPWHGAKKAMMNVAVDGMFYFGIERGAHRTNSPAMGSSSWDAPTTAASRPLRKVHGIERAARRRAHVDVGTHARDRDDVAVTFEPRKAARR